MVIDVNVTSSSYVHIKQAMWSKLLLTKKHKTPIKILNNEANKLKKRPWKAVFQGSKSKTLYIYMEHMVKERDSSGTISNSSAVQVDLHWHIRLLCYSLHFSNSSCPETNQKDKTLSQRMKEEKKQNLMWDSIPKLTWFVRSRRRNVVAGWRSAGDWLTRLRLSFHPQVSGRRRRRNDRCSLRNRNCQAELRSQNLSGGGLTVNGGRQLHLLAGSGGTRETRRQLSSFESAKTTTLRVKLPLRANSDSRLDY